MSYLKTIVLLWYFTCNVDFGCSGISLQYIYFSSEQKWATASRVCQSYGAHLATINSQRNVDILLKYMYEQLNIQTSDPVWIGLHRTPDKKLVWSDDHCSEHNSSTWSNFEKNGDAHYDENKQCFRHRDSGLHWDRESCTHDARFICEKEITSGPCDYVDTNRRLSIVPVSSASTATCQTRCDNTEDCVMVAPYCTEHCILAFQSSSNSSTQLYNKVCSDTFYVSVNRSNMDAFEENADDDEDPLPCSPEPVIGTTVADSNDSVLINCSVINQPRLITVTMTPDVVTSTYLVPCDPSTVVSTVYVTPSKVTETGFSSVTQAPQYVTVTMTTCIPPDVTSAFMTSCDLSTVVSTVVITSSPVIETIRITPSPVIETIYITPSPLIKTVYVTPTPVIETHISTTPLDSSLIAAIVTSSNVSLTSDVFCTTFNNTNLSHEKLEEVLEEIVVKLKVDTKNLSTTTRKKTSAPDRRRSSTTMGYTAGVVMCIPFVLMVMADIPRIFRDSMMDTLCKQ